MAWNSFLLTAWSASPVPQHSLSSSPFKHTLWASVPWDRDTTREISLPALTEHRGTITVHSPSLSFSTPSTHTLFIVFYAGIRELTLTSSSVHQAQLTQLLDITHNIWDITNPLGCLHSLNTAHVLNCVFYTCTTCYSPTTPPKKTEVRPNAWVLHATAATELETMSGEVILIHKTG